MLISFGLFLDLSSFFLMSLSVFFLPIIFDLGSQIFDHGESYLTFLREALIDSPNRAFFEQFTTISSIDPAFACFFLSEDSLTFPSRSNGKSFFEFVTTYFLS